MHQNPTEIFICAWKASVISPVFLGDPRILLGLPRLSSLQSITQKTRKATLGRIANPAER